MKIGNSLTIEQRFFEKIFINESGCWVWTAHILSNGYGSFRVARKMKKAHRVSYEWFVGPISEGTELDHLCRHRNCVRPEHLEAVTHLENMRRGDLSNSANGKKTHCPKSHEYTTENTWLGKSGNRQCRACNKLRARVRRAKLSTSN